MHFKFYFGLKKWIAYIEIHFHISVDFAIAFKIQYYNHRFTSYLVFFLPHLHNALLRFYWSYRYSVDISANSIEKLFSNLWCCSRVKSNIWAFHTVSKANICAACIMRSQKKADSRERDILIVVYIIFYPLCYTLQFISFQDVAKEKKKKQKVRKEILSMQPEEETDCTKVV